MDNMTIRQVRRAKEISAETMAAYLNIHQNTYLVWEKTPSKIPIEKAYKICELLDISYDSHYFLP